MYAVDLKFAKTLLNEIVEARAKLAALNLKPERPMIKLTEKAAKELLSDPQLMSKFVRVDYYFPIGNEHKRKVASKMFTMM